MQRVQAARSPECAKNRQMHKPFLLLEIFISGVGGRVGACPNQVEYDPIAALPTPSPRGLSWPCPGELVRPAPHSPVGTRWQPLPPSLNSTTPPPMVRMRPTHPLLRAQGEAELRVCLHDRRPRGRPRALESPVPGPPRPRARPPRAPACCPHSVRFDLRPRSRPHPSAAPRPRRLSASQLARNPALPSRLPPRYVFCPDRCETHLSEAVFSQSRSWPEAPVAPCANETTLAASLGFPLSTNGLPAPWGSGGPCSPPTLLPSATSRPCPPRPCTPSRNA